MSVLRSQLRRDMNIITTLFYVIYVRTFYYTYICMYNCGYYYVYFRALKTYPVE